MQLKGSKTHDNLKAAFAGESQANRRYLYFAAKADVEGQNDVAAVFRSTAEGETGHAHGHLEYLETCGDPATDLPFGKTRENLKAAIAGETHEYTDMYPGMAKTGARRKVSARSPTGSRRWRRPSARTPTASRRRSTRWPTEAARRKDEGGRRKSAFRFFHPSSLIPHAGHDDHARREPRGSHAASARLEVAGFLRRGQARAGARARLRHLPRLPPLRESLHGVSDAVRSDRREPDAGARRRAEGATTGKVVDQCYLCDMCYMTKCPYVPPHPWNVDFPHLMLRAKAVKFRKGGAKFRDRLLSSTDALGKLATIPVVVQFVNAANRSGARARACMREGARRAPGPRASRVRERDDSAAPRGPQRPSRRRDGKQHAGQGRHVRAPAT